VPPPASDSRGICRSFLARVLRYIPRVLLLETFPVGDFQCNCSILGCPDTKQAMVVDPGGAHAQILEVLRHYDLTVTWIVHTHAHLDHIYETREVKEQAGGTIALHQGDAFLYDGFAMQAAMFGWAPRPTLPVEHWLQHDETLTFGHRQAKVVYTPGHTPGSCCFQIEGSRGPLLFSGDTLFQRSIGRTDLPGGDSALIAKSIRERLYTLDPDTQVIPGHGPPTTIGDEQRGNPFVRAARA
jgi:glyoxylase-like metal-dependent hydrolase (beta-lactamase superfamily II)